MTQRSISLKCACLLLLSSVFRRLFVKGMRLEFPLVKIKLAECSLIWRHICKCFEQFKIL